jgi:hypothetical protein
MATTTNSGPNLTKFTYLGRQFLKLGGIFLVVLIVGRMAFNTAINVWKVLNPPAPLPPTVGFGILPGLRFPEKTAEEVPESYVLETATGGLPGFPDRAKVFLMTPSSLGLLADSTAKNVAASLGFIFEPDILSTRIYRWTKSQPLESTLQLDVQTLEFNLTTDYLSRPELLSSNQLPDNFKAVQQVKSLLTGVNLLGSDMATASGEVVYKKSLGGELVDAVSFSDADFLEVDLNRTPIDGYYRMFTPEGYKGVINAVVMGSTQGNDGVVFLENHYHEVDYSQWHTYPLRSVTQAWRLMQNGEGYVASFDGGEQAVIRNVYLGYYDDFEEQDYLQPVYVFTGDDDFVGYVSALDPSWVQKSQ